VKDRRSLQNKRCSPGTEGLLSRTCISPFKSTKKTNEAPFEGKAGLGSSRITGVTSQRFESEDRKKTESPKLEKTKLGKGKMRYQGGRKEEAGVQERRSSLYISFDNPCHERNWWLPESKKSHDGLYSWSKLGPKKPGRTWWPKGLPGEETNKRIAYLKRSLVGWRAIFTKKSCTEHRKEQK